MNRIINHEKTCGISIFVAHFPISIRKIHRLVCETENDITTPVYVIEALSHEDGVGNSYLEFVHIGRHSKEMIVIHECARKKNFAS